MPAEFEVHGLVDNAHPSRAKLFDDAVVRNGLTIHTNGAESLEAPCVLVNVCLHRIGVILTPDQKGLVTKMSPLRRLPALGLGRGDHPRFRFASLNPGLKQPFRTAGLPFTCFWRQILTNVLDWLRPTDITLQTGGFMMKRTSLVLLLILGFATWSFAGKISGGITEGGKPIAKGVKVDLTCGTVMRSAETDAYGAFSVVAPEGKCTIKVNYQTDANV